MEYLRQDVYGVGAMKAGMGKFTEAFVQQDQIKGMYEDQPSMAQELEKQFPWLREIDFSTVNDSNREKWYKKLVEKHGGEMQKVRPIAA